MSPPIIWKGEEQYEHARVGRIFNNRRPATYPSGIVKATSIQDVAEAVKIAKERNLKITVRSGGHSWAAWSLRDSSLMVDLENLKEMSLDAETGILTCSPSSTGQMINVDFLAAKGRLFPGGHCPSVAVGGFLLQGGQGWNCRGWKWAAEYIDSMDVVTASGELVTASERENADLFWAARGAGLGFFGVVVRFRLQTVPLPKHMIKTIWIFDASAYEETFIWFQKTAPTIDLDVELVYLGLSRYRCLPGSVGKPEDPLLVISGTAWKNTLAEAESALEPLLRCPRAKEALVSAVNVPTSFKEEYATQERDNPADCRFYVNNAWINGSPEEVAASLKRGFLELPTPDSYTLYYSQAPLRKLPDMAFDMQTEHYYAAYVMSTDSTGNSDEKHQLWIDQTFASIDAKRGGAGGSPGQYLGDSDVARRPTKWMSNGHWARFCGIRKKWDANGLFWGYNIAGGGVENAHLWESMAQDDVQGSRVNL